MAEPQMHLFRAEQDNRVIIVWSYHDAGYYWTCPECVGPTKNRPQLPFEPGRGTSVYDLKPEMECGKCGAQFQQIPGDADISNTLSIKYGYLLVNG